ncbi:MAG: hypothetical protein HRT35_11340 [Algicola sp.]|nr:hypothetical protein [Algicola sp.]
MLKSLPPLNCIAQLDCELNLDGGSKSVLLLLDENPLVVTSGNVYLYFEEIIGHGIAPIYDIYINIPNGDVATKKYWVGGLSMYGLEACSTPSKRSKGLNRTLEVGCKLEELYATGDWRENELKITLQPTRPLPDHCAVVIGRVSLFVEQDNTIH